MLHVAAAYDEFLLGAGQNGLVQGKLYQGAWNLLFFALVAILIAIKYNWHNGRLGYWLNLAVISVADIGFLIFVLIPGHVTLFPAILGPILWLSGAIFTTLGIRTKTAS